MKNESWHDTSNFASLSTNNGWIQLKYQNIKRSLEKLFEIVSKKKWKWIENPSWLTAICSPSISGRLLLSIVDMWLGWMMKKEL